MDREQELDCFDRFAPRNDGRNIPGFARNDGKTDQPDQGE
jgi:hypothetical protein